jgi:hypothetical protein
MALTALNTVGIEEALRRIPTKLGILPLNSTAVYSFRPVKA